MPSFRTKGLALDALDLRIIALTQNIDIKALSP